MTPNPDPQAIEDLKALLDGATPGPWFRSEDREGRDIIAGPVVVATVGNMGCNSAYPETERRPHIRTAQANAALIVALVNAAPSLISKAHEAEGLKAEVARLTKGAQNREAAEQKHRARVDQLEAENRALREAVGIGDCAMCQTQCERRPEEQDRHCELHEALRQAREGVAS